MAINDKVTRTIKCDNQKCTNEISFDPQNSEEIQKLPDWLRTTRTVQNGQRKSFTYCSDVCEVKGVTTGDHNAQEPKKVTEATEAEARQVAANIKASEQLRTGATEAPRVISTES
jgi:hypothetical protein